MEHALFDTVPERVAGSCSAYVDNRLPPDVVYLTNYASTSLIFSVTTDISNMNLEALQ